MSDILDDHPYIRQVLKRHHEASTAPWYSKPFKVRSLVKDADTEERLTDASVKKLRAHTRLLTEATEKVEKEVALAQRLMAAQQQAHQIAAGPPKGIASASGKKKSEEPQVIVHLSDEQITQQAENIAQAYQEAGRPRVGSKEEKEFWAKEVKLMRKNLYADENRKEIIKRASRLIVNGEN